MKTINIQPTEKRRSFDDGSVLDVHSIFYTIQGEGPFCGYPAVFVRLAGCNLQCPSCDTEYTAIRQDLTPAQIVNMVQGYLPKERRFPPLVVITGGEPFRQNIGPLVRELSRNSIKTQIETNGTLAPYDDFAWPGLATIVCSPKAGRVHGALLKLIDAYKYVLSHDSIDIDGLPIRALNHTASPRVARPHAGFTGPVYLQPMDPKDDAEYVRNVAAVRHSCMRNGYILQLQVHKLIGVE